MEGKVREKVKGNRQMERGKEEEGGGKDKTKVLEGKRRLGEYAEEKSKVEREQEEKKRGGKDCRKESERNGC